MISKFNNKNDNPHKKVAFTLAEVLITLGIIGVVAALTLPSLISKCQKIYYVNQFKSTYSILNSAIERSQIDNGPLDTWDYSAPANAQNYKKFAETYIVPYLKIAKNCGTEKNKGCLPKTSMKIWWDPKQDWIYAPSNLDAAETYKFVLTNGMRCNLSYVQNCVQRNYRCITFTMYGTAKVKPILGRTAFLFDAYPVMNRLFPRGTYNHEQPIDKNGKYNKYSKEKLHQGCSMGKNSVDWCGARIIIDGYKMEY